jgi:hypothetical protein
MEEREKERKKERMIKINKGRRKTRTEERKKEWEK